IVAMRPLTRLVEAAIIVVRGIGEIEAGDVEGRPIAARLPAIPIDGIIVRWKDEIHALGEQLERTVGARKIGTDVQRSGIIAAADRELVGVGFTLRGPLESVRERVGVSEVTASKGRIAAAGAGVRYGAADDVALTVEDDI